MPLMDVVCVLPARLSSTRISRKPLQAIAGRSLLEWCWRLARGIPVFDRVVVATDAEEIASCARAFDAEVVRTRADHVSGTDRVEETAESLGLAEADIVVNFQADEPFVDAATIERAVAILEGASTDGCDVATLAAPIRDRAEWESPGIVKVARAADGRALYFSRSPIPWDAEGPEGRPAAAEPPREPAPLLRHVGVYACRRGGLRRWSGLPESPLERRERLEQLRALEAGMRFHVEIGPWTEPGIDLPADLRRAERVLSRLG